MEELQKQIIAIQIIQELIVDKLNEVGVFTRIDFEKELQQRVKKFNEEIDKLKKLEDAKTHISLTTFGKIYEA
jgi:site-specific recombinase